jgi:hypothetical protein
MKTIKKATHPLEIKIKISKKISRFLMAGYIAYYAFEAAICLKTTFQIFEKIIK